METITVVVTPYGDHNSADIPKPLFRTFLGGIMKPSLSGSYIRDIGGLDLRFKASRDAVKAWDEIESWSKVIYEAEHGR